MIASVQSYRRPNNLRILNLGLLSILLFVSITGAITGHGQTRPQTVSNLSDGVSAVEFARMVREFSEGGGSFISDNFTSNETSYLHIVAKLRQLGAGGGAYIGVGPEQNFTYIAKIRPRVAFIVDIRRQAIVQHLMFKAIFHLSATRTEFLSRLLSRPLPKEHTPAADPFITQILTMLGKIAPDEKFYAANLVEIERVIQTDFQFTLNEPDRNSLEYVYKTFRDEGLDISFKLDGGTYLGGYFPSLKDLILQTDLEAKLGNFLSNADDYAYVRGMHRKNLIIPVVGDFAGSKALSSIGEYLQKNNLTVSAFYTSNVEQYLFDSDVFDSFAKNIRKLPLDDKSVFIRAVFLMRYAHPAGRYGHLSATVLQPMKGFLKDFDAGSYKGYRDLIMSNYISGDKP